MERIEIESCKTFSPRLSRPISTIWRPSRTHFVRTRCIRARNGPPDFSCSGPSVISPKSGLAFRQFSGNQQLVVFLSRRSRRLRRPLLWSYASCPASIEIERKGRRRTQGNQPLLRRCRSWPAGTKHPAGVVSTISTNATHVTVPTPKTNIAKWPLGSPERYVKIS
jgi:hypothetical protein